MDFFTKNVRAVRTGDLVKLNIFDTAGEEKFHAVTACHYRKAKGAVIVYDVTNRESFEHLDRWLNDVRELADSDCVIMVLGNKCDVDMTLSEGALSSERS
jgi:small GTP-binding protein